MDPDPPLTKILDPDPPKVMRILTPALLNKFFSILTPHKRYVFVRRLKNDSNEAIKSFCGTPPLLQALF